MIYVFGSASKDCVSFDGFTKSKVKLLLHAVGVVGAS